MIHHSREACFALLTLLSLIITPFARAESATVAVGKKITLTASANGTAPFTYQWLRNGVAISGQTGSSYAINSVSSSHAGNYTVKISNKSGSNTAAALTLVVSASTTTNAAPKITTQPVSKIVATGGSATFSVVATGTPAPKYQWKLNGTNISGATSASYTVTGAKAAQQGDYTVAVTNSVGTVASAAAKLTVTLSTTTTGSSSSTSSSGSKPSSGGSTTTTTNVAPKITTQPASKIVATGGAATFSVVATGSPAPKYQWKLNGTTIAGATSASYTVSGAKAAQQGDYTVAVTNAAGTVVSTAAKLTVTLSTTTTSSTSMTAATAPKISAQPIGQTVTVGSTVSLTVAASGSPAPTYQWRKDGVALSGATSASLDITDVSLDHAGDYSVAVTNSAGTVTSSIAALDVTGLSPALVVGADLNQDGWSDLVWFNPSTGACTVTYMNGQTPIGTGSIGNASSGSQLVGTGDFNGDGKTDLLWRGSDGSVSVWVMSGATKTSSYALSARTLDWQVVGVGDFNNDGRADVLWRNSNTGECGVWILNNTAAAGTSWGVVNDLALVGSGDFNGDGKSDLIWMNTSTYEVQVQLMNGVTRGTTLTLGTVSSGWTVAGTGDFNDDGRSDILWQTTAGRCDVWFTNGSASITRTTLMTVASAQRLRN